MRLRSLDSVRGIAALVVVLHHAVLAFPSGGEDRQALMKQGFYHPFGWLYLTPLRLLVAGPVAVVLFFVLSGLVLSAAFVERDGERYPPFLTKRIARIWMPFAFIILLSAALSEIIGGRPLSDVSSWFNVTWSVGGTISNILSHLAMTGVAIDLDNPMWSLVHEMRISIIFPFLVLITIRWPKITCLLSIVILFAIARLPLVSMQRDIWAAPIFTGSYIFLFVFGIIISKRMKDFRDFIGRLAPSAKGALLLLSLLGLAIAPSNTLLIGSSKAAALLVMNGLAAGLLLVLCVVEGRTMEILLGRFPTYLGRISYSLYLSHVVVLVAVVRLTHLIMPLAVSLSLAIGLALLIADLSQRYIEVPTTNLGRHIAGRWWPSTRVAAEVHNKAI